MYLFRLGRMPRLLSMVIFHQLAREGVEALVIVSPEKPIISIGYFQDAFQEVDLDFLKTSGLPLFRREVGGGTTYLDENQIFYQVIYSRKNRKFPQTIKGAYELFSDPPCRAHEHFGIKARFREVNDLVTPEGKKIGGEGGADIGECMVFVGSMLMDFDYQTMSKVAKIPDEKWRDKVFKTLEENLTTMKRELGELPDRREVEEVLISEFKRVLGPLEKGELPPDFLRRAEALEKEMQKPEFLFGKRKPVVDSLKIKSGLNLIFGQHKSRGGLIRTVQEVEGPPIGGKIQDLSISGDFTLIPRLALTERLEKSLIGSKREKYELLPKVESFIESKEKEMPGVTAEDIVMALGLKE